LAEQLTETERETLLAAVKDQRLSDRTVRMIVLDVLEPTPPAADDIEWARGQIKDFEDGK
jgi:hypothetical protein